MSFLVCFGKPVLFKFEFNRLSHVRLSVGFIGLWVFFFDLENFFGQVKQIVDAAHRK